MLIHPSPFTLHHSSLTIYHSSFIIHISRFPTLVVNNKMEAIIRKKTAVRIFME